MLTLLNTLTHIAYTPQPMQHATLVAAGVIAGAGVLSSVIGGIFGGNAAKKAARRAAAERAAAEKKIAHLQATRQAIINPYANVKDISGMAKDLSGMIKNRSGMASNKYASLSVSTQAAKFQAQQTDMALANTLDALRETGSSAGGATALAQAALQSKQGISASIEQQEANNEKLRAQGEESLQNIKIAEEGRTQEAQFGEAGRVQNLGISESLRTQSAETEGSKFQFNVREDRQQREIDRVAGVASSAANREAQANADRAGATAGMISGITSAVGGFASAAVAGGAKGGGGGTNTGQFKASNYDVPMTRPGSDRRLKKNITRIGTSASGLNIYSFEYKDEKFGSGLWQGVMSDEIPAIAVINHEDGFDRVDYSLLDVEFKKI